jgi:transcriptional regulator with XRE-family HTH domain
MATRPNPSVPDEDDAAIERREIGERLKLTRKALFSLGIAPRWQKDFAAEIGFPASTYNQCESGKQILTPAQATRIYQRYGISLNWIYMGVVHELPSKLVDAIEKLSGKKPNSLQQLTSAKTTAR